MILLGVVWALLPRLSPGGLRGIAEAELQRLGLTPQLTGALPAPGCRYDLVSFEFRNAAAMIPSIDTEIRRLVEVIMQSAPEPLPRPLACQGEADLLQVVEEPEPAPAATPERLAAIPAEETV
jgi:hypothetical protein